VSGRPPGVAAVLLDIEGTTTPVVFVTEVLFPYVRAHLAGHVERHGTDARHAPIVDRLRREHESARQRGEKPPPWTEGSVTGTTSVVAFVNWLMDLDRKSTPLKELQGLIWEVGYRQGHLVGEVFPDVPPALGRWRERGMTIAIFSSGSVLAQRLLFQYSSAGDLTGLLHAFFDTETGAKGDADSYRRISRRLDLTPDAVLFLSDVPRELDAARAAGMHARLVVRPGNAAVPETDAQAAIRSFDAL
jgi:enolase-phosphatase E1